MPNLKIHVDDTLWPQVGDPLRAALPAVRDLLCDRLKVTPDQVQLAILPVAGVPDQPSVNVEFSYMPKADRPRDLVVALCEGLRGIVGPAAGAHVAVRAWVLDPGTYVALK